MLQFSGTLRNASSRLTPMSSWRIPVQQLIAACSGNPNPSSVSVQAKERESLVVGHKVQINEIPKSKNPMVQAAFNTLKVTQFGPESSSSKGTEIEPQFRTSANVMGLLKMVDNKRLTPQDAYAMVTLLIDWVNNGKAKLSDFELDNRFLYLCELVSRSKANDVPGDPKQAQKAKKYLDELNLFYGVNEINEAIKEVANITVKQMIKVMAALAQQKRRTTPLLRSLAFNISRSTDVLNIKQLSDLLYSMAILNYPDEVLLQKVSTDLMRCIKHVEKSAVIGSILTSLGLLRYKNEQLMDDLSVWVVNHSENMRPQDLCSFFLTLATVDYTPLNADNLNEILIEPLKEPDMTKPAEWLDVVWALTVLQMSKNRHVASVLDSSFIAKLADSRGISVPKKHKLLNINGAAQLLLTNYDGPLLENNSEIFTCPIERSKEKQTFVRSVTSAVQIIFPSPEYVKLNVDLGMGFLLDAEVCINSKGERLPVKSNLEDCNGLRIAMVPLCYNDFCRGKQDPVGFYDLNSRILRAKGYQILSIPHTEFSTEDQIVQRTLYVKNRIKKIIAT